MTHVSARGNHGRDRGIFNDILAGAIVAASNVALAASFAAAIFQGELAAGIATAVWAILASMIVVGVLVGWRTTLQPIAAGGPDTAVVAVMSLLAGTVAGALFAAGTPLESIIAHVMLAITIAAIVYGLILFTIGWFGWARALRFVPYPLIGGFLAATGVLLLKSSPEVILGAPFAQAALTGLLSGAHITQLWFMAAYAAVLLISHHTVKSPLVMPLSFFVAVGAIHMAGAAGLIDRSDWFVVSMSLTPWEPFAAAGSGDIQWSSILAAFPEIAACVLVGLFSLTVRISTIETMRKVSADMDAEFRTYGAANMLAAPLGAMPGGILFSTSKLIQVAGYRSPICYIVMAAILLSIVVWGADLSPLLPKPVLGGLLLYLGYTMSLEAVRIVFSQSGLNLFAALLIFLICLNAGFLAGAIFGVLAACLIFAIECSRSGVVRHHITRADVSGGTEWPSELEEALRARGKAIQIFELSGYIFFGSSEKLFDRVRAQVRQQQTPPVRFILLDFTRVSGFDTTAVNTLIRLQSFARQNNIWTIYCALPADFEVAIVRARLLDPGQNVVHFPSRIESVFWCETQLLQSQGLPVDDAGPSSFSDWMSEELGLEVGREVLTRYFDKKNFGSGEEVYRQGSPASTIDFIASGSVLLILETPDGPQVIRRATRRTVIGEMGFFRNVERSVSICAEEPLTLYSLTRDAMTELEEEMPDLHAGILAFIVRVLCDRLEMANHEISALR